MLSKLFGLPLRCLAALAENWELISIRRKLRKRLGRTATDIEWGYAVAPLLCRKLGYWKVAGYIHRRYVGGVIDGRDAGIARWMSEHKPERNV